MSELKPCPFCNSNHIKYSPPCNDVPADDWDLNRWDVVCRECGCNVCGGETKEEATKRWNTRAIDKEMVEKIVRRTIEIAKKRNNENELFIYKYGEAEIIAIVTKEIEEGKL